MIKIICGAAIITAVVISIVNADVYKWTEKDGTINYSDTPPVSGDKNYEIIRSETPKPSYPTQYGIKRSRQLYPSPSTSGGGINKNVQNETKEAPKNNNINEGFNKAQIEAEKQLMEKVNSLLPPNTKLSDQSKGWVVMMLLEGMNPSDIKIALTNVNTDEDMNEILEYFSLSKSKNIGDVIGITNSAYNSPESTWSKYKNSLMNGDLESAYNCLTPTLAFKHRQMFKNSKKEDIIKLGTNMNQVSKITMEGNSAKYRLYRMENGTNITYYVYFVKLNGNWKVRQF